MKRAARDTEKSKRRAHFLKFENLVGSAVNMRGCEAAVALMRRISQALHYLEGNNVESSHVAAVFVVADQNAKSPAPEITDYFDSATMDLVKGCFEDRWNGAGRKVGVKHGVHCLSFKVDMVLRCTIEHALGAPFLAAIDGSFRRSSWDTALLTYCKQDNSRYTKLVMEMTKFNSKTGDYASLWRQADAIAKETVAEIVQKLDSDTKANPLRLLIAILKHTDEKGHKSISSRPLWGSIAQEEAASLSERLFGMMCVEVLSIVTQACAVERINKDHGCVHNRARASMANHTTRKALYIFTNESLLQKLKGVDRPNPLRLTSFELFLSNAMPPVDGQDIISKLVQAPVSSFLPAGEDRPRSTPGAREDTEDMDEDFPEGAPVSDSDSASSSMNDDDELDGGDGGYIHLADSSPPDGSESYEIPDPAAFIVPSVMSVTAGNWLSQHGGRSSTGRETVLPRRQKPYPPCVLSSPRW